MTIQEIFNSLKQDETITIKITKGSTGETGHIKIHKEIEANQAIDKATQIRSAERRIKKILGLPWEEKVAANQTSIPMEDEYKLTVGKELTITPAYGNKIETKTLLNKLKSGAITIEQVVDNAIERQKPKPKFKKVKVESTKSRVAVLLQVGASFMKFKQYDHALDSFKKALELDPENKHILFDIDQCNKWMKAIDNLEKSEASLPTKEEVLFIENLVTQPILDLPDIDDDFDFEIPTL